MATYVTRADLENALSPEALATLADPAAVDRALASATILAPYTEIRRAVVEGAVAILLARLSPEGPPG